MKRFLRMITLLGVLFIIGSCSSSKSVNTTNITGSDIIVTFGVQDYYATNYMISGFITIENTSTHEVKQYKRTEEVQGFMVSGQTYDITWNMLNTTTFALTSNLKYDGYKFSPVSRNIKFKFGITDYAIEEE
ncbi:MAG: hypothetical protein JXM74_08370 [Fusobacteriaceae bacterium]|nr:hypothetical protein [Fusobacteriaceae bacterium]MBN2838752.1 hypothetical protein [Fusobacteriaceae bacterium]